MKNHRLMQYFRQMELYREQRRIIVTCSNRITPHLESEVRGLGFEPVRIFRTGVELMGDMQDCMRLNLRLRCASQVLMQLHRFRATDPDQLYREASRISWEALIPEDGYFSITSNVHNLSVNNPLFANVKLKDAIVDRFRQQTGRRPNSGPEQNRTVIHLYWQDEQAEVFLDTSGETLSKHGYRKIPGKAPMLESLAAATLVASRWSRNTALINPMCGSGTIAIEAALLASKRYPGLLRNNYGFMHVAGYRGEVYQEERALLDRVIQEHPGLILYATDISQDAVNIAMINAEIAGVKHLIRFSRCDFAETPVPEESAGVVFMNPEYGDRLGLEAELESTYKRMGDFMKQRCKGYHGYIFTGNLELAKKIGLKASRRIEFFNGKIDCRLLEYELYSGSKSTKNEEKI